MIIATTALLFYACAMHGYVWHGVWAFWPIAAACDTAILIALINTIFTKKRS